MSHYQVQKILYEVNRHAVAAQRYNSEKSAFLREYDLTDEEARAFTDNDIGLLYVLGAHPSLLIHFAGVVGIPIAQHRETLLRGVQQYGPVRAGILAQVPDDDL